MFRLELIGHCGEPSSEPHRLSKSALRFECTAHRGPERSLHPAPSVIVRRALAAARTI
jgi:hypothetical protein